jgi:hypothetical protein
MRGTFMTNMYGTQLNFNHKKQLSVYDQNGKRKFGAGSRQTKRQYSQVNNNKYGKESIQLC